MDLRDFILIAVIGLLFNLTASLSQNPAPPCDQNRCNLPDCLCSSTEVPGNLSRSDIPQLVFLSFDEAVNIDNLPFYQEVFYNRTNPNGELITLTFYVSHDYTDYPMLHDLWRRGHEIGLNSISLSSSEEYWRNLNETGWSQELADQREQIHEFAFIPLADLQGVRFSQSLGFGDTMYNMLEEESIKYDYSRPTNEFRESGLWPYTNDYASIQDCLYPPCPVNEHKGLWTVPIINLIGDEVDKFPCYTLESCIPVPKTEQDTFDLLNNNFKRHHDGHRAPFGVSLRHGWVNGTAPPGDMQIEQRRRGFIRFLDHLATLNDTYIVSVSRGIQWVQNPVTLKDVPNFPAFQTTVIDSQCPSTQRCYYGAGQTPFKPPADERNMYSCAPCPAYYPWVGNHLGRNPYT